MMTVQQPPIKLRCGESVDPGSREWLIRLEGKIDTLVKTVARLESDEANNKQNMARFWAQTWPSLESKLENLHNRLGSLERIEVHKLDERVDSLERDKARLKGWLAGVAAASSLGGAGVAAAIAKLLQ